MRSHYNIRADMDLLVKDKSLEISMSCFPCCYVGCVKKLKEDIKTRYIGPSNKCDYWEVLKKADGGTGYNYWRLIEVVPSY